MVQCPLRYLYATFATPKYRQTLGLGDKLRSPVNYLHRIYIGKDGSAFAVCLLLHHTNLLS